MKRKLVALSAIALVLVMLSCAQGTSPAEERAVWADAFHVGYLSRAQLTTLIQTLANANCNIVIPEVRKYGDAYYDSAYEPRATNITTPLPYDPLGEMIPLAHAQGIEVHPWIVTYRIWSTSYGTPPPTHVWALHQDWAMKNSSGSISDGGTYYLDPGVPGVQDYLCKVVLDIVSKYDVNGFNWDYVRYPGTNWGYNDYTKERFRQDYGYYPPTSGSDANWNNFRRQQVTDLVKKCYLEIMAIKPHVKHSVDSIGWMQGDPNVNFTGTRQYSEVFQDSKRWMEEHIIDMNILMNYKREYDVAQKADFRLWSDWLSAMQDSTARHSLDGIASYLNSIADTMAQIYYARSRGLGICLYSYGVTNKDGQAASLFWAALKNGPYIDKVPPKDMPWKSNPTTGIIFGTVTKASGAPDTIYQQWLYKADVSASGPVIRSTTTDGTGTYGFIDIPPGVYTITISKSGYPTRTISGVSLGAGDVIRKNAALGSAVTVTSPAGRVAAGWNLVSLPLEPVNRDPVSVFNGISIDGMLYKWDNTTQGLYIYDSWSPEQFGNVDVENGYWIESDSAKTISYQAYPTTETSHTIPLPNAGWTIMGCPFQTTRQWASTMVQHGRYYVPISTAKANNWINTVGYWWDSSTQGLSDMGLPEDFATSEVLQPWHGYWIETYVDDMTLTLK